LLKNNNLLEKSLIKKEIMYMSRTVEKEKN
jgi:hypothetical protein